MKTFGEYTRLDEKLILFNHGARYGQIVIVAGGTGSGKGFVIDNFIEGDKFKILNVDNWKEAFLSLSKLKNMYPEIRQLSLSKPEDVYKLHVFIREKGIKDKVLQLLFGTERNKDVLPNIIFDITGKSLSDIIEIVEMTARAGYESECIHLLYVLTQWKTAYQRNLSRSRIVPSSIFIETHRGATQTLQQIITHGISRNFDGAIKVVLNNPENTEFHMATKVVKDFDYLTIKDEGDRIKSDQEIYETLGDWLEANAPKSALHPNYKLEK